MKHNVFAWLLLLCMTFVPDVLSAQSQNDYVTSPVESHYDLGVVPTTSTKVFLQFSLHDDKGHDVMGVWGDEGKHFALHYDGGKLRFYINSGDDGKLAETEVLKLGNIYCVTFSLSEFYLDSSPDAVTHINSATYTANPNLAFTKTLYLGGFNGGDSSNDANMRIYQCLIYQGGSKIRHFVPARVNGEGCLYEAMQGKYYSPLKGSSIAPPVPASCKHLFAFPTVAKNESGVEQNVMHCPVCAKDVALSDYKQTTDLVNLSEPTININDDRPGYQMMMVAAGNKMSQLKMISKVDDSVIEDMTFASEEASAQLALAPLDRVDTLIALTRTKRTEVVGTRQDTLPIWDKHEAPYMPIHQITKIQSWANSNMDDQGVRHPSNTIEFAIDNVKVNKSESGKLTIVPMYKQDQMSDDLFAVQQSETREFSSYVELDGIAVEKPTRIETIREDDGTEHYRAWYAYEDDNQNSQVATVKSDSMVCAIDKRLLEEGGLSAMQKSILKDFYTYPLRKVYYRVQRVTPANVWTMKDGYELVDSVLLTNLLPHVDSVKMVQDRNWEKNKKVDVTFQLLNPYPWEYNHLLDKQEVSDYAKLKGIEIARRYMWDKNARVIIKRTGYDVKGRVVSEASRNYTVDGNKVVWNESQGCYSATIHDVQSLPYVRYYYTAYIDQKSSDYPVAKGDTVTTTDAEAAMSFSKNSRLLTDLVISQGNDRGGVVLEWDNYDNALDLLRIERRTYEGKNTSDTWERLVSDASIRYYKDESAKIGKVYEYRVVSGMKMPHLQNAVVCDTLSGYGWVDNTGKLSGRVMMNDGTAMANVKVRVTRSESVFIEDVLDEYGNIIMKGVNEGVVANVRPMAEEGGTVDVIPQDFLYERELLTDENGYWTLDSVYVTESGLKYTVSIEDYPGEFQYKDITQNAEVILTSQRYENNDVSFKYISTTKIKGFAYYRNSTVAVPGAHFYLEGVALRDSKGELITTLPDGSFSLTVSNMKEIGMLEIRKDGHMFADEGVIRQHAVVNKQLDGIILYDDTKVRIAGRIVGGDVQAKKPMGAGLSTNNLGDNIRIELQLEGDVTASLVYFPTDPDRSTVSDSIYHIVRYSNSEQDTLVGKTFVKMDRKRIYIDVDNKTGEFMVDLFPAKYKVTQMTAQGYSTLYLANEGILTVDYSDVVHEPGRKQVIMLDDEQSANITTTYDTTFTRVYHAPLSVTYQQVMNGRRVNYYGEKRFTGIDVADRDYEVELVDEDNNYNFGYPVFKDNKLYQYEVRAHEDYHYNNVLTGLLDEVPVGGGRLTVQNGIGSNDDVVETTLDSLGRATVYLVAGNTVFTEVGEMALRTTNFTVINNGLYTSATPLRGFILGEHNLGNDVTPLGSNISVIDVLRDPPGSKSYAYRERGTKYEWNYDTTENKYIATTVNIKGGFEWITATGFGIWTAGDINAYGAVNLNISTQRTRTRTRSYYSMTLNERISTGDDIYNVGAGGDVYIGMATTYGSRVDENMIVLDSACYSRLAKGAVKVVAEDKAHGNYIVVGNKISLLESSNKIFAYSQKHIVNNIIPSLERQFRSLVQVGDSLSVLGGDCDHARYWYNPQNKMLYFKAPAGNEVATNVADSILTAITCWKSIVAQNEQQKLSAIGRNNPYRQYSLSDTKVEYAEQAESYTNQNVWHPQNTCIVSGGAGAGIKPTAPSAQNAAGRQGENQNNNANANAEAGNILDAEQNQNNQQQNNQNQEGQEAQEGQEGQNDPNNGVQNPGENVERELNDDNNPFNEDDSNYNLFPGEDESVDEDNKSNQGDDAPQEVAVRAQNDFESGDGTLSRARAKASSAPRKASSLKGYGAIIEVSFSVGEGYSESSNNYYQMTSSAGYGFVMDCGDENYIDVAVHHVDAGLKVKNNTVSKLKNDKGEGIGSDTDETRVHNYVFEVKGGAERNPWYAPDSTLYYNPGTPLGVQTLKIDNPKIYVEQPVMNNVSKNENAVFSIRLTNAGEATYKDASQMRPSVFYLRLVDSSNPLGAKVFMDGQAISDGRSFTLKPGETITKTIEVQRGTKGYDYDNLRLAFHDECRSLYDYANISVHYLPESSPVSITMPTDKWVMNTYASKDENGQYYLPVEIGGFNLNYDNFHHIEMQYKRHNDGESQWVTICSYFSNPDLMALWTGEKALINYGSKIDNIRFYGGTNIEEQEYDLRAVSFCSFGNGYVTKASNVVQGIKDTRRPEIFGMPSPANGILTFDDVIQFPYTERIAYNHLNKTSNFTVRGYTNDAVGIFGEPLHFDGTKGTGAYTSVNRVLANRDFTIDMMAMTKPTITGALFYHGGGVGSGERYMGMFLTNDAEMKTLGAQSDNDENIRLGLYTNDYMLFSKPLKGVSPSKTLTRLGVSVKAQDNGRSTLQFISDQSLVDVDYDFTSKFYKSFNLEFGEDNVLTYQGQGPIYVGNDDVGESPVNGDITEVRLWDKALSANEVKNTYNKRLTGYNRNLIGYWPMNEGTGEMAYDKVAGATMNILAATWKTSSGYSLVADHKAVALDAEEIAAVTNQDYTLNFWFRTTTADAQVSPATVTLMRSGIDGLASGLGSTFFGYEGDNLVYTTLDKQHVLGSRTNYCDGAWHNFGLTVSRMRGKYSFYLDGQLVDQGSDEEIDALSSTSMVLGDAAVTSHFDEFALWHKALSTTYMRENYNTKLHGTESDLMIYLPFQKDTVDAQNTPIIAFSACNQKLSDQILDLGQNQQVETGKKVADGTLLILDSDQQGYGTELGYDVISDQEVLAPLRSEPEMSNLDFSWSSTGTALQININREDKDINKQYINVTVRDIEDEQGNTTLAPHMWTYFVDKNILKWDNRTLNLKVKHGESLIEPVTWRNLSGKQSQYKISHNASWLTLSSELSSYYEENELEGTAEAEHEGLVYLNVGNGLSPGEYSVNVYLTDEDDLSDALTVNLTVEAADPEWAVDATKFEYSMDMRAEVMLGQSNQQNNALLGSVDPNTIDDDPRDKVGAFVGQTCVGVANIKVVDNNAMLYLTIYGDAKMKEDASPITLRLWRASTGVVTELDRYLSRDAKEVSELQFVHRAMHGMPPSTPNVLRVTDIEEQTLKLEPGWNWVSLNVSPIAKSDQSTSIINTSKGFVDGDVIKRLQYLTYYEKTQSFSGSLSKIDYQYVYQVYAKQGAELRVRGRKFDLSGNAVEVADGYWTDCPYYLTVDQPVNVAMSEFNVQNKTASIGDVIKSYDAFAVATENGWEGSLTTMRPGVGYYIYHTGESSSFHYHEAANSRTQNAAKVRQYNASGMSDTSMPIIAVFDDEVGYHEGDVLEAYCNGQLIASTPAIAVGKEGVNRFFLSVNAEQGNEISFGLRRDGEVVKAATRVKYNAKKVVGAMDAPCVISMTEAEQIDTDLEGDTYNVAGYKVPDTKRRGVYVTNNKKVVKH